MIELNSAQITYAKRRKTSLTEEYVVYKNDKYVIMWMRTYLSFTRLRIYLSRRR